MEKLKTVLMNKLHTGGFLLDMAVFVHTMQASEAEKLSLPSTSFNAPTYNSLTGAIRCKTAAYGLATFLPMRGIGFHVTWTR